MIDHYGIDATAPPKERFPADREVAFGDLGSGECLDACLGFGAFKTARESKILPRCRARPQVHATTLATRIAED